MFAQFQQAVAVALTDGADFPLAVAAVDLRENQRGVFAAHAGSERDVQRCGVVFFVLHGEQRFAEAAKVAVWRGVVDAGGDVQRRHVRRDGGKVNGDAVVAEAYRAVGRLRLVVEDDVVIARDFAIRADEENADVRLKLRCFRPA